MRLPDLEAEERAEALGIFLSAVAPTLTRYATRHQWGIRAGTTLYEHLMNGALFLGTVLPALGVSSDDVRLALAAFTLHDANKMLEGDPSLPKVSLSQDFDVLWERHAVEALVSPALREVVRTLVVNTSHKHGKTFDLLLADAAQRKRLERLRAAMAAADIHDLSTDFFEQRQKQRLCEHLREATGRRLELFSHLVGEDLGAMTALAHTAARRVMQARGAIETWVYPEGSWYVGEPHAPVTGPELHAMFSACREEVLGRNIAQFVDANAKDGFKLHPDALTVFTDAAVALEMEDFILQKKHETVLKTVSRRKTRCESLPEGLRFPETAAEIVPGRLWLAAENFLKTLTPKPASPTMVLLEGLGPAEEALQVAGPRVVALRASHGLHPIYDLPYVLMASTPDATRLARLAFERAAAQVRKGTGAVAGELRLDGDIMGWLDEVQFGDGATTLGLRGLDALARYTRGTASSLGAARGDLRDLKSDVVPKGTPVSQFSNRQGAGRSDPTRKADGIQLEGLRLQTRTVPFASAAPLYLHLQPKPGITPIGWHASAGALARELVGAAETAVTAQLRSVEGQMTVDWVPRNWGGQPVDKRPLHGNGMSVPWRPIQKRTELEDWLDALTLAAAVAHELSVRVVLSRYPGAPAAQGRLEILGTPTAARWLVAPVCSSEALPELLRSLTALRQLAGRHPGNHFDTASLLVRAGSRGLFALFAALDRRAGDAMRSNDVRTLLTLYPETSMSEGEQAVFAPLRAMAELTATKLKTHGFKRSDLARPLNELFKALRRISSPSSDQLELGLATAEDRIFEAKRTDTERQGFKVGEPTQAAARAFIEQARHLVQAYGSPTRLRADERRLRSAFIALVRRALDAARSDTADAPTTSPTPE